MKTLLCLALALLLTLSLAPACAEPRTVTFWHCFGGTIGEAFQATVDAFNKSHDDIQVIAQFQGAYDDTLTKLKAALPAGAGPDVCQMFELGTCYLAGTDYVIPFQDMLDKDPYISLNQVEGVLRNYYTVNGKWMCITLNPSSPVMYYNKTAFERAGITDVPTTFAEIEAIADQLTGVEGNPQYAMGLSIYGWFFENLLAGTNNYYVNNENGRAGVATAIEYDTNGGGKLVMESWKRLVDEGVCYNFGVDNDGSKAAFIAGTTAITFESTAQLSTIRGLRGRRGVSAQRAGQVHRRRAHRRREPLAGQKYGRAEGRRRVGVHQVRHQRRACREVLHGDRLLRRQHHRLRGAGVRRLPGGEPERQRRAQPTARQPAQQRDRRRERGRDG